MKRHFRGQHLNGDDLTYFRVLANVRQAELARRLKMSPQQFSDVEQGTSQLLGPKQGTRVVPRMAKRYVEALIKELRAQRRCHFHGVPPVDLDRLFNQERDFGLPLTGQELAKVVRLKTAHEFTVLMQRHGTALVSALISEGLPLKEPPPQPPGSRQIIFGQGNKPQLMPRPTPSRTPNSPPEQRPKPEPEAGLQEALDDPAAAGALQPAEEDEVEAFAIRWQG